MDEIEETKSKLYTFKLGNNFGNFITDVLTERINNLDYYEALEFLRTAGLGKDEALGVLFGDYEITNTENEIILADNFSEPRLDLHAPIEKFINDYVKVYREIMESTCNILNNNKLLFVNIYDTNDEDLPILTKYFTIDFDFLMNPNSGGQIGVSSVKFYDALYTAYKNIEFEDLLEVLSVSYNKKDLTRRFEYYVDSRAILNTWEKLKRCVMFLEIYDNSPNWYSVSCRLSEIEEKFRQGYELITDEQKFYNSIYSILSLKSLYVN